MTTTSRDQMRLSIALCTFDGERHLPELLSSIAQQLHPPDEIIVCDDGSGDRTIEILSDFRDRVAFPVEIRVNEIRLGSTRNFEKAIGLCRGEIIFLCDQDDIWHREKVARAFDVFTTMPEVGAVFSNAELIDERSLSMGRFLWETLGFGEERLRRVEEGNGVEILLEGNVVTGATMGFRSEFKDLLLPIPDGWVQDYWIALLVAAVSEMRGLGEPLVRYRIHAGQQIGIPIPGGGAPTPLGTRSRFLLRRAQLMRRMRTNERGLLLQQAAQFRALHRRLADAADTYRGWDGIVEDLRAKAEHLEARGTMPNTRQRWRIVARELRGGRYRRFSSGLPAAVKDLLLLDRGAPPEDLRDAWAVSETPTTIFMELPGVAANEVLEAVLRRGAGGVVFQPPPPAPDSDRNLMFELTTGGRPQESEPPMSAAMANLQLFPGISAVHLRRFRLVAGAFWLGVHEFLAPQPSRYVTLLSHPVERVLALYRDRVEKGLSIPLHDYVEQARDWEILNGQTRRLAPSEGEDVRYAEVTGETVERAKRTLKERFAVAGVSDRLEHTLVLARRALGLKEETEIRREVGSLPRREEVPPKTLRRIEELNQHDLELYRFATALLEERIEQRPSPERGAATHP